MTKIEETRIGYLWSRTTFVKIYENSIVKYKINSEL